MGKLKAKFDQFRFKGILVITFIFALISIVLFIELSGVQVNYTQKKMVFLEKEQVVTKEQACGELEQDTLLLYSSEDKASASAYEQFAVILDDMKVGTLAVDLAHASIPNYQSCAVVIVLFSDLSYIGEELINICKWVYDGGNVLFPLTIDKNAYSSAIENKIGIEASYGYTHVERVYDRRRQGFSGA